MAADPSYTASNPTTPFFTSLVKVTHFRPAYTAYPKISDAIQVAMEAVMTGQSSTAAAMAAYASTVTGDRRSDQHPDGIMTADTEAAVRPSVASGRPQAAKASCVG